MLINAEALEDQLRQPVNTAVREAYLALAHARLPDGITVRPASHGYISRELRFEAEGDWLYSAVLNRQWVLWYFRRPALNSSLIRTRQTLARFPEAEATTRNEIKLRVFEPVEAHAVLDWIGADPARRCPTRSALT